MQIPQTPNIFSPTTIIKSSQVNENFDYLTNEFFPAREVWTYASANTFTIPGDLTLKYTKGTKIRLTNGAATKYFYVVSSSYSAPNTTITISGEVDLVNGAIIDPRLSRLDAPDGFKRGEDFFKARAYNSTPTSLINNAFTKVDFQTKNYDPNSNFDIVNSKYVAPIQGYYLINIGVRIDIYATLSAIEFNGFVRKNAASPLFNFGQPGITSSIGIANCQLNASDIHYLNKGDYIELLVFQLTGANRNTIAASNTTFLSVQFIGL